MKFRHWLVSLLVLPVLLAANLQAFTQNDIPIIKCPKNRKDKRSCSVSICALFRDEAKFLKEWIEYHRLVGVSHFYLFNNCSTDNYLKVLKPYIEEGVVELFHVPFDANITNDGDVMRTFVQVQVRCYQHAINLAKGKSHWIAIIDSDEFICPVIDKTLPKALKRYDYAGGLAVYWQIYGTSNVWDLQSGELLIEKLLYKGPNVGPIQFKSIVKPKFAKCMDCHWTKTEGAPMVLPNHQPFTHTPNLASMPIDIIRINHYTFRTESFNEQIKKPRRRKWGDAPSEEQARALMNYYNSEYDPIMLKIIPQLKRKMFHKKK
jgi:hypothetical protein